MGFAKGPALRPSLCQVVQSSSNSTEDCTLQGAYTPSSGSHYSVRPINTTGAAVEYTDVSGSTCSHSPMAVQLSRPQKSTIGSATLLATNRSGSKQCRIQLQHLVHTLIFIIAGCIGAQVWGAPAGTVGAYKSVSTAQRTIQQSTAG